MSTTTDKVLAYRVEGLRRIMETAQVAVNAQDWSRARIELEAAMGEVRIVERYVEETTQLEPPA